jgi:opacity protein-like surface antigen
MKHFLIGAVIAMLGSASYAEEQPADDKWQFKLTPYLWLAGITADAASSDGVDLPPINPDYQFFSLENFDGVAFLTFTAEKNQWAIHNDLVYISFADTIEVGPVDSSFDLSGGTLELSAGYRPDSWQNTHLVFGLRGVKVSLDATLTPGPTGSDSRSFIDPIIGLYHRQTFDNHWGLMMRGDIGSSSSELMVNAVLAGTYQFTDTFTLVFGYRYLKIDFKEDDFLIDLSIQGYSVGFQFDW